MKPLLPTLKERHRYIIYEVVSGQPLGVDISHQLLQRLSEILGVFGTADAGMLSISYDNKSQQGMLRVSNKSQQRVIAALVMITTIGKHTVAIRTRGVSGIMQKAKRFLDEDAKASVPKRQTKKERELKKKQKAEKK